MAVTQIQVVTIICLRRLAGICPYAFTRDSDFLHSSNLPICQHYFYPVGMMAALSQNLSYHALSKFAGALVGFQHDGDFCSHRNVAAVLSVQCVHLFGLASM